MEVSALKYSGGIGLHGRSRLLRLQSDERLVAMVRRGNTSAFEVLVARYESRLLAFCRHLLGSREDAEDVLQEVMTAAFNAMLADERPINVRPWLYRIARNRSLNHLRRIQAIGVDSMDLHFSDGGASTADKVHEREEFRLLVGDIHALPETQKTALVLREMDALSYEQIAEAMETTVSSVKSLLVRARVSLAEAAEARVLSCEEVRIELAEVAEGLQRRPSALVRRHLRGCKRCTIFRGQLKQTNKALAALLPIGPTIFLKKLLVAHLGHSAASGSGATAAGSGAAGAGAAGAGAGAAGAGAAAGSGALVGTGGVVSAGIGAIATKAAAGLAAAALVTGAAVEAGHSGGHHAAHHVTTVAAVPHTSVTPSPAPAGPSPVYTRPQPRSTAAIAHKPDTPDATKVVKAAPVKPTDATATTTTAAATPTTATTTTPTALVKSKATTGRTQTQSDATVLPPAPPAEPTATAPAPPATTAGTETTTTSTTPATPTTTTTTATTPASTGTTTGTTTTPPPSETNTETTGTGTTPAPPASTAQNAPLTHRPLARSRPAARGAAVGQWSSLGRRSAHRARP